ncbi:hypothetical protein G15_2351 [Enterococcus avium]|nr:hypothetical protein G15_2351 [Enterococcus avium]
MFYYLCAIFTLISAGVSLGFSIEAFLKAKQQPSEAIITAKYAVSRSLSLFLTAIGLLIIRSNPYLIAVSIIMIGVQLFDGIIGIKIGTFKMIGPLLTALGNSMILVLFLLN